MRRLHYISQKTQLDAKIALPTDFFGYPKIQNFEVWGDFEGQLKLQSALEMRKSIRMICSGYLRGSLTSGDYADIKIMAQ